MSAIDPFATAEQFASLWGRSSDAFLDAQRSLVQELAGWMPAVAPGQGALDSAAANTAKQAFARSWEAALDASRAAAENLGGVSDPMAREALERILDPEAWFARSFGRTPADGQDSAAPVSSLVEATMRVQRRGFEHDVVLVEAWMQAAGAFARALNAAGRRDAAPISAEALADLWRDHATPIFAETERSDAFRRSRDRLAAATGELDAAQRAMGRIYGYASRADLDGVRETLAALRREVEASRRASDAPRPPIVAWDETRAEPDAAATPDDDRPTAALPSPAGDAARSDQAPPREAPAEAPEPAETAEAPRPADAAATLEPAPRVVLERAGGGSSAAAPVAVITGPGEPAEAGLVDALAADGRAVFATTWSDDALRSALPDLVRDLEAALDATGSGTLIGIGAGGILALCCAARRPLAALAAVETAFAFDERDEPGADVDWLAGIRRDNALLRGRLAIDGEPVDLASIACPVLNLIGRDRDGAEASRALGYLVASDDYAEREIEARSEAGPLAAAWLGVIPPDRTRPADAAAPPATKSLEMSAGLGHMGAVV